MEELDSAALTSVDVADDDICALLREQASTLSSNTLTGSSDDRGLTRKHSLWIDRHDC